MPITGHLVHLAVRALGALRTASPPHLHPKWVWVAFILAMVILCAERAVHHDLGPTMVGAISNGEVWARFRQWHLEQDHSAATIRHYDYILHDLWRFLEQFKVTGPDGRKRPRQWWQPTSKLWGQWLDRPCRPHRENDGRQLARDSRSIYSTRGLFFYRWASDKKLLPGRNPLSDVRPVRKGAHRPRALPFEDVTTLLNKLTMLGDRQRLFMMVCLAYYQLLRIGEICRLSVEDIDLYAYPPMLLVHGKGGRDEWMELNPELIPILRTYLITRPSSGPLLPSFTHPSQHLTPNYASHLLAEAMLPLVGDSAHALRHTSATELRAAGVDLLGLQRALRHANPSSTMVYVNEAPHMLEAFLSLLPNPLQGQAGG